MRGVLGRRGACFLHGYDLLVSKCSVHWCVDCYGDDWSIHIADSDNYRFMNVVHHYGCNKRLCWDTERGYYLRNVLQQSHIDLGAIRINVAWKILKPHIQCKRAFSWSTSEGVASWFQTATSSLVAFTFYALYLIYNLFYSKYYYEGFYCKGINKY